MRADGKRVKHEDPMYLLSPHFLTKRYDAMNMITLDIPEGPMKTYMNEKRKENRPVSHMALVITAYLRAVEQYPSLNRFIMGKKIYQRNEISVSMVVLKPGGGDTMSKLYLEPGDNVFEVQRKIDAFISQNRQEGEANSLDKAMNILVQMSGLTSIAIGIVRLADRLGLLPKKLIDVSPFHASLLISNLASIRTNHIYHHIYQFGTIGVSLTIGNLRDLPRSGKDGTIYLERCMPLGVVVDDRVANGHYFAQAFSLIKKLLTHPEMLEASGVSESEKAPLLQ